MELDKNLEKRLCEIGSKLDAKIKEADALVVEAHEAIGFMHPQKFSFLEYYEMNEHRASHDDICEVNMGEDLVRYSRYVIQKWEREARIKELRAEVERLGVTKDMLFP